jgi:hypothetical protein
VSGGFSDNTTLSGSFVWDADTRPQPTVTMVDITVSMGSTVLNTYLAQNPAFPGPGSPLILNELVVVPDATLTDFTGTPVLDLLFSANLSDAGIPVSLIGTAEFLCNSDCSAPEQDTDGDFIVVRSVSGGTAAPMPVTTPEPSALLLLGMGLVPLLGIAKNRIARI